MSRGKSSSQLFIDRNADRNLRRVHFEELSRARARMGNNVGWEKRDANIRRLRRQRPT